MTRIKGERSTANESKYCRNEGNELSERSYERENKWNKGGGGGRGRKDKRNFEHFRKDIENEQRRKK